MSAATGARADRARGARRLPARRPRRGRGRASTRWPRPRGGAARCRTGCATRSRSLGRRLQGEYHEDEWGFDEEFAEAVFPLFEFLYEVWWRVEADGVRNVPGPRAGAARRQPRRLAVPFDATMMTMAIMKEHPLPRWPRFMVLDWAFVLPFLSASCAASAASRRARTTPPGCSSRTSW